MAMYADFSYYKNSENGFSGVKVKTESEFNRFSADASAFIDQITFCRVAALSTIPDAVRNAVCGIVDVLAGYDGHEQSVASESKDGFAVSFRNDVSQESASYDVAEKYLAAMPELLYRGIDSHGDE